MQCIEILDQNVVIYLPFAQSLIVSRHMTCGFDAYEGVTAVTTVATSANVPPKIGHTTPTLDRFLKV